MLRTTVVMACVLGMTATGFAQDDGSDLDSDLSDDATVDDGGDLGGDDGGDLGGDDGGDLGGDDGGDDGGDSFAGDASATSSEAGGDGGRFRFGIASGVGTMSADINGTELDMTYYGLDMRFGWQIDDALAVYAQPQLGYYSLDVEGAGFAGGGLTGVSLVADYTVSDMFFAGAGFGYAILNSPDGSEVHLRVGAYPLMGRSATTISRKGLMLGIDFRLHFVEGFTFVAPTFNVGYESF